MNWEEPAAREYPAAGQPAYDGVPPSSGTVEGTAAPMLARSVPWCRRAWLARLRAPGQGLDPIAVVAESQPENLGSTSVAASGTAVSSGSSSLSRGSTGAMVSPRTPAVGVVSTASCWHWRSLTVATSGGTTVRRGLGEGSRGMRERASAGLIFPGLYWTSESNCASCEAHLCSDAPNFAEPK